jgi:hypothetical protein
MGRPCKWHILSAANARTAKQRKHTVPLGSPIETTIEILDSETELPAATGPDNEVIEVTKWTGGVNLDNHDYIIILLYLGYMTSSGQIQWPKFYNLVSFTAK